MLSAIIVIVFIAYNNFSVGFFGLKMKGGDKVVKSKKPIKEF